MSFRAFLFIRQESRCYLRTTAVCKERDGLMRLTGKRRNDFASVEHVIPRSKKGRGEQALILLACCNCNNAKGNKDPDPAHVDLAVRMRAEWRANWWNKYSPRAQQRAIAKAFGVTREQAVEMAEQLAPEAMAIRMAAVTVLNAAAPSRKRTRENAEREAEDRRRKQALGLDQYEDSSKSLSKLRRATANAIGR